MPNPLAALFLPRRRLASPDSRLLQRGGMLGGTQWVAPRGALQYRQHDFSSLPQRQRHAAALLHAQRLLPTADSAVRIGWLDGVAHFWLWADPLPAAVRGRGRWIPESALRRPMVADGAHLLECLHGVEGQIWREGALVASQWWPAPPQVVEWRRFLRGGGLPVEGVERQPQIEVRPLQPWSWAVMQHQRDGRLADAEYIIWVGTLALLAAAAGWQAASLQHWKKLRETQTAELDQLRASSSRILSAREEADEAAAGIADLAKLQRGLSDYALIADIIGPLPSGTQMASYMRESDKIGTMLKTSEKDLRKLVLLYRAHPLLREVSAIPSGEFIGLEFQLPKPPQEDAGKTGDSKPAQSAAAGQGTLR